MKILFYVMYDKYRQERKDVYMVKNRGIVTRLFRYIKPHWYLILASTVAGVVKLTLPLLAPQILRYFTDYVLVESSAFTIQQKSQEILKWTMFLVGVYILFIFLLPISARWGLRRCQTGLCIPCGARCTGICRKCQLPFTNKISQGIW